MEIQILDNENKNEIINYIIQLKEMEEIFIFKTRYSILYDIHKNLKKSNKNLPNFPKKKLFGSKKKDFLEKRQIELEFYLQNLLKYKSNYNLNVLLNYFKNLKKKNKINDLSESNINENDKINNIISKTFTLKNDSIIKNKKKNDKLINDQSVENRFEIIYKNFQEKLLCLQKYTEYIDDNDENKKQKIFKIQSILLDSNNIKINSNIFSENNEKIKNDSIKIDKEENEINEKTNKEIINFNDKINLFLNKLDIFEEDTKQSVLNSSKNIVHIVNSK